MAKISLWDIKKEILVFIRNQDIISTSDRGVNTSQDTGTFAADTEHTLNTNPTLVKNVRSVIVGGITLKFGEEYTVNYDTGVIIFDPEVTGAYTINYDQGSTDRIFPDFPQPHLKISQFPRIAIDIISGATTELALGGESNWTKYTFTVVAYDKDQSDVEEMIATIREKFMNAKKDFYYSEFITPTAMGPFIVSPFGNDKIFSRNQDLDIMFIYED